MIAAIAAGVMAASAQAAPADAPVAPPPPAPATAVAAPVDPADVQPVTLTLPPAGAPPPADPAPAIRDAFQAAERSQGPFDGRWRLSDDAGRALLIFQLSDPGTAPVDAGIVGAWRDPNRTGATDSSGFLTEVDRQGDGLAIKFCEHAGDPPTVVTLQLAIDGEWRGELSEQGARQRVVMDPF